MSKTVQKFTDGQQALEIVQRLKGRLREGSEEERQDAGKWLRQIQNELIDGNPISAFEDEYLRALEETTRRVLAGESIGDDQSNDQKRRLNALTSALARERTDTKNYIRAARKLAKEDAKCLKSGSEPPAFTRERLAKAAGYHTRSS